MKISCLVVDDVALNRQALLDLAGEVEFLNIAGQCSNAQEALNAISELEPDIIFLDIEMPGMSGLEFLKSLADPPLTVITTSHPEFAVEGYEMQVFDYIVKPVTRERFHKCAERIVRYFKEKRKPLLADQFFLKDGNRYVRIRYDEVKYIEAMRDFVVVYLDKTKYATMQTMKNFAARLPEDQFIRVHRSYIVPIKKIEAIESGVLRIQEMKIPISDSYRAQVMKALLGSTE
jgi:DNA-binding LytR/AlgR family response regulator